MSVDKGKKKGQANSAVKAIDINEYIRQPIVLPELVREELPKTIAYVKNSELIFPEWDITSEPWNDSYDEGEDIRYPEDLCIQGESNVRTIFGLDIEIPVITTKEKGKKSSVPVPHTKGKKGSLVSVEDLRIDEHGRRLPRIFVDDDEEVSSNRYESLDWDRGYAVNDQTNQPIDPRMCEVFDIVKRFGSKHKSANAPPTEHLWNLIYPKQNNFISGKPCYNPSGRYCVKLYYAGKFRKITINDSFPMTDKDPSRPWAIARSSHPMELWPSLLSKAIYSMYSQCKYDDLNRSHPITERNTAFIGFAIYALTGWFPQLPVSVSSLYTNNRLKFTKIIETMISNDIQLINSKHIPSSMPKESYNSLIDNDMIDDKSNTHQTSLKTLKTFQTLYETRKQEYFEIFSNYQTREENIRYLNKQIQMNTKETYVLHGLDKRNGLSISYPILGIHMISEHMNQEINNIVNDENQLEDIRFLVDWKIHSWGDDIPTNHSLREELLTVEANQMKHKSIQFPSLPKMTSCTMKWISWRELIDPTSQYYLISLETYSTMNYIKSFDWNWITMNNKSNPTQTNKSQSSTTRKGENNNNHSGNGYNKSEMICMNPGNVPSSLLAIDLTSFYDSNHIETSMTKDVSISINISIVADMISKINNTELNPSVENIGGSPRLQTKTNTNRDKSITTTSSLIRPWTCSESCQIIIEELIHHIDSNDIKISSGGPYTIMMELPIDCCLPMNTLTYRFPITHLQSYRYNQSKALFLVRFINSCSSFHLIIRSSVNLEYDEISKLYSKWNLSINNLSTINQLLSYPYILSKEGMINTWIRPNMEQILFRIIIKNNDDNASINSSNYIFLHISEPLIAKYLSLLTYVPYTDNNNNTNEMNIVYPKLIGNLLIIPCGKIKGLLGRIYCTDRSLPPFKWNLIILSNQLISEYIPIIPSSIMMNPSGNKGGSIGNNTKLLDIKTLPITSNPNQDMNRIYQGFYYPNNQLLLFKDYLIIDKSTFPLAFKLTLNPLIDPNMNLSSSIHDNSYSNQLIDVSNIYLILKIKRKSDNVPIYECRGQSTIICYSLNLELIKNPLTGMIDVIQIQSNPTNSSSVNKLNNNLSINPIEGVELIIECYFDSSRMIIPSTYHHRQPYMFHNDNRSTMTDPIDESSLTNTPTYLQPHYQWNLHILSGTILFISHDLINLENYQLKKLLWDELQPGRSELARIAIETYHYRKQLLSISDIDSKYHRLSSSSSIDQSKSILSSTSSNVSIINSYHKKSKLSPKKSKQINKHELFDMDGTGNVPTYDQYIDILGHVLKKDSETVHKRYDLIKTIPMYQEHRQDQVLDPLTTPTNSINDDSFIDQYMEEYFTYHQKYQSIMTNELETLSTLIQSSNDSLLPLYEQREKYKIMIDNKNQSLLALLDKGKTAMESGNHDPDTNGGKTSNDKNKSSKSKK